VLFVFLLLFAAYSYGVSAFNTLIAILFKSNHFSFNLEINRIGANITHFVADQQLPYQSLNASILIAKSLSVSAIESKAEGVKKDFPRATATSRIITITSAITNTGIKTINAMSEELSPSEQRCGGGG